MPISFFLGIAVLYRMKPHKLGNLEAFLVQKQTKGKDKLARIIKSAEVQLPKIDWENRVLLQGWKKFKQQQQQQVDHLKSRDEEIISVL